MKNITKKNDVLTAASPSDFFLIPLDALRKDNPIEFDVWIEHEDQIILHSQCGSPLDVTAVDELAERKITKLFVHRNDRKSFCGYVELHLSTIIDDDRLNEPEKARAANMAATNLAQEIVLASDGSRISRAQRLFVVMSSHARRKSDFLPCAIRAVRTDGELETHCANMPSAWPPT